jgi:hypothetical protein
MLNTQCITKFVLILCCKYLYDFVTYRGLDRQELVTLTETSTWCEQLVEYDCYRAPLK